MSIHLKTVSLDMDRIDKAISINDLSRDSRGVDFKVHTQMTDMNLVESILQDKLLGFKNKRNLINFRNQGQMIFYYENNTDGLSIVFFGNYPKNDTIMFINNLTKEYLTQTNQMYLYEQIPYDVESFEEEVAKKVELKTLKISTNMKNKAVIESIMDTSYLGYNSKKEIDDFKNRGLIVLNKADDDTYDVVFLGDYENSEAEEFVENLSYEYANKIQEITYEKVLEKIHQKNYSLESEVIDANDSIVLTLNVN
ncbi:hypothetical protein [Methanosphaera sp. BMS]|uniref:hypothetical protein n=1 Tax=Methanosphaera sp. BMS TaxID=1789762 RepID=UPI000DC1DB5F|nr:hypothetical protein [Methanosphaera sp. BMS]AWX32161.1 hypothetical protein AW729_03180 [Methanosphaera sp. BMS]